jgi:outer membrane lipoprotein-sorting protein
MTLTPHSSQRRSRVPKRSAASAALAIVLGLAAAGCAPKRFAAPADPGVPVAAFADAWRQVAAPCLGVRTLTAELALSGRAGGTRLRGRVQAGFEAPGRIRLEGVAPFGQPVFILAGDGARATLLLPRDERVVQAADAAEILEALAGVRLGADTLRAVVAGCAMTSPPTGATQHGDVIRLAFDDGAVYVRMRGAQRRIVAAEAPPFLVEYLDTAASGAWPRRVRISRGSTSLDPLPGDERVDLTIDISQVETNMPLPPEAFTIDVPPGAMPMTLAQLRAAGPLGDRE